MKTCILYSKTVRHQNMWHQEVWTLQMPFFFLTSNIFSCTDFDHRTVTYAFFICQNKKWDRPESIALHTWFLVVIDLLHLIPMFGYVKFGCYIFHFFVNSILFMIWVFMGIGAWRNSLLNWIPSFDLSKPSALELTHILSENATNSEFAGT